MSQYRDFSPQDDPQQQEGDARFLGVNARLSPEQLAPGMLADGQNVRMRNGTPDTRLGVVKPGWLNVTRAGVDATIRPVSAFGGVGNFKDPNGVEWVLIVADGNVYRCRPNNERFALPLPVGVRLSGTCVPVQAFNEVYLFRGRFLQPLLMSSIAAGFLDVVPRWSASVAYQAAVVAAGTPAQEVAYGPFQVVTSVTSAGNTATVVTPAEHGYAPGADVVITGANQAEYNGRWPITVVDVNTFTFPFPGSVTSPATGTIKVSNMANYWRALGTVRKPLASLTRVGTTATATFNAHGFSNGQSVTIAGATPIAYDGVWVIQNVTANTFDYILPADPGANATGAAMSATTSVVLAGQSPNTNPEAWQQIFNVLPNADDALFIDNRLLVPTAYTPGSSTYDSTSSYTKKDFIVAMDIGDNVHFFFTNELRINQGSADEIVSLVKYDADTVVVFKSVSWGVLTGLAGGDLSTVKLDMRSGYGSSAPRAAVVAGKNVLFPVTQRGICSLQQTELGETRSVDIPFSNDLDRVVQRIDWTLAEKIRLAWWDDKLYCAVALKNLDSDLVPGQNLVPAGAEYSAIANGVYQYDITSLLVAGQAYSYQPGLNEAALVVVLSGFQERVLTLPGTFVFDGLQVLLVQSTTPVGPVGPFPPIAVTAAVSKAVRPGCNNAILVYDFRMGTSGSAFTYDFQSGQWNGYDAGSSFCVQEFFLATFNGRERLFFLAEDGYVNLMEEAQGGDQVGDSGTDNALGWENIVSSIDSRGYASDKMAPEWFKSVEIGVAVWNANFSISVLSGAAGVEKPLRTDVGFSRTKYLKPVGAPDYVEGNVNGDFARPGRGDYSVRLLPGGVTPGFASDQLQELTVRVSLRPFQGKYAQFRIVNTQGRLRVKSVGSNTSAGFRRDGLLV